MSFFSQIRLLRLVAQLDFDLLTWSLVFNGLSGLFNSLDSIWMKKQRLSTKCLSKTWDL